MTDVLTLCCPLKVVGSVIQSVPIQMVNLQATTFPRDENLRNQPGHEGAMNLPIITLEVDLPAPHALLQSEQIVSFVILDLPLFID
jgi:hypothetical protein